MEDSGDRPVARQVGRFQGYHPMNQWGGRRIQGYQPMNQLGGRRLGPAVGSWGSGLIGLGQRSMGMRGGYRR